MRTIKFRAWDKVCNRMFQKLAECDSLLNDLVDEGIVEITEIGEPE